MIALLFPALIIIVGFGALLWLKIEMYFLEFKVEKHPLLIQMLEDALNKTCENENIRVFQKTYDEINADETDESKKALGQYVYSKDPDYQIKLNQTLAEIEDIEKKYGHPYHVLCQQAGVTVHHKEEFVFPKILLCKDYEIKLLGTSSYYHTWFHELGHHFAYKELGAEGGGEDIANKYAAKLMKENLPHFFLLFFDFGWWYRRSGAILTQKEKTRALLNFFKYLITEYRYNK